MTTLSTALFAMQPLIKQPSSLLQDSKPVDMNIEKTAFTPTPSDSFQCGSSIRSGTVRNVLNLAPFDLKTGRLVQCFGTIFPEKNPSFQKQATRELNTGLLALAIIPIEKTVLELYSCSEKSNWHTSVKAGEKAFDTSLKTHPALLDLYRLQENGFMQLMTNLSGKDHHQEAAFGVVMSNIGDTNWAHGFYEQAKRVAKKQAKQTGLSKKERTLQSQKTLAVLKHKTLVTALTQELTTNGFKSTTWLPENEATLLTTVCDKNRFILTGKVSTTAYPDEKMERDLTQLCQQLIPMALCSVIKAHILPLESTVAEALKPSLLSPFVSVLGKKNKQFSTLELPFSG